ncbi:fumarylacetoacetate hydrolase family protein [Ramlibacter sp.]|uniref:fumarylacetoacetate hydrolase family protein n=1 Tax=Ramlibacter sp. TaxID=1917967 RepID=UPI002FCA9F2F
MKLLRYGPPGQERPGLLDAQGNLRDLSALLRDIDSATLSPRTLAALRALDPQALPRVPAPVRLGVPWSGIGKFIAVGLNYRAHAAEGGIPVPDQPVLFPKWLSCLSGANDDVLIPHEACKLDWEVELGIVIGTTARDVPEDRALEHVAGYCVANDVSDRHYQFEGGAGQWGKGKGFDTFGPVGPYLVTADEVPDPQALDLWLSVNGETMQQSNTSDMVFGCASLVSHCSRFMTLEPGDLIITGTPQGVGLGMKPPRFLRDGDVVTLGIAGLGTQTQRIVARRAADEAKPSPKAR